MKEFKKIIKAHLDKMAKLDATFAANYKKPNKDLDECIKFIFGEMRKRAQDGCAAAEDKEVYGLAMHYYDEDDIKVDGAQVTASVEPKVEKTKATRKSKAKTEPKVEAEQDEVLTMLDDLF